MARQKITNYSRRSLAKPTLGGHKVLIDPKPHARGFPTQQSEPDHRLGNQLHNPVRQAGCRSRCLKQQRRGGVPDTTPPRTNVNYNLHL